MSSKLTAPRGTRDVLPEAWRLRQHVLDVALRHFDHAGYGRLLTPTFEHTEVFARGAGETSDIVGKEMYTFTDRGDRSLTLRPEGTAAAARSYVEHGMQQLPQPVRLWYFEPMFRYEKPQEGRYREHWQIGAEAFGSVLPSVDAELVCLLAGIYRELGVEGLRLRLNSIGEPGSRDDYRRLLVEHVTRYEAELDEDSRRRIATNPLRIFDSKVPRTREIMADAPKVTDHLDPASREHLDAVRGLLASAGVEHEIDPSLVRGIDYYTRTVFEFSSSALGAQDAVGSGGRYDNLVATLGGPPTPAVGFGCGIERLEAVVRASGVELPEHTPHVYVCVEDESQRTMAFALTMRLRAAGLVGEQDLVGRSPKGQLKQASRLHASVALLAGSDGWCLHQMQGRQELRIPDPAEDGVEAVASLVLDHLHALV
jgi:histidyl-tRNA synthetase